MSYYEEALGDALASFVIAFVEVTNAIQERRSEKTFAALDDCIEGYYESDGSSRLYVDTPDGRSCGEYNYRTWKIAQASIGELYLYEQGDIAHDTVGGLEIQDCGEFNPAIILPSVNYRRQLQHPKSVRLSEVKHAVPLELLVRGVDGLRELRRKYQQLLA